MQNKKQIQKHILEKSCLWCGKSSAFETWQFWAIDSMNKDHHNNAKWCSDECFEEALNSKFIIGNHQKGEFHEHKGKETCMGEYYSIRLPLRPKVRSSRRVM